MTDTATNDTGGTPLDAALAYARHGWRVLPIRPAVVVSEQVPNLTVAQLPGTVRAWDNGLLHAQHNDPGRAGKRNRGPEPSKEAPMGTSYSSSVGGQESDSGPAPCDLYRFYDGSGTLLYVGISLHAAQRASEHRKDKAWWPDVASMTIQHLPTRAAALEAERVAIINERPLHNVVHNRGHLSMAPRPNLRQILWLCDGCRQPMTDGDRNETFGYIQVRSPRRPTGMERERWEVMHRRCDPNVDSTHYWVDIARLMTEDRLLDFDKHMRGKVWTKWTDWSDVVADALMGVGFRHER